MLMPILIGFAVIVFVFVIIVATRPADFRVTRSATIAAPPAAVFEPVNDFHKWDAWSPWAKLDPTCKNTFAGASAGKGAKFAWDGNNKVGAGRMTVTESQPPELIRINLEFLRAGLKNSGAGFQPAKSAAEIADIWCWNAASGRQDACPTTFFKHALRPFKATNTAEFIFKAEGKGTVITWNMFGKNNFLSKAFGLFMNCDKMIGGDFEKGLAQLKSVAEAAPKH